MNTHWHLDLRLGLRILLRLLSVHTLLHGGQQAGEPARRMDGEFYRLVLISVKITLIPSSDRLLGVVVDGVDLVHLLLVLGKLTSS